MAKLNPCLRTFGNSIAPKGKVRKVKSKKVKSKKEKWLTGLKSYLKIGGK